MPNTFFHKITYFCSLLLLLTPETLPYHLFRETNDRKWSRKLPKRTKINFLFFIIYFTFSLSPYGKKQNHLPFPPFLSPEIGKPQGKMSHEKFFFFLLFFLLFCILPLLVIVKITTYLFLRNSDFKCPKIPLSALKFHFLTNYLFPAVITRTHTPSQTHSVFPTHNASKTCLTPFSYIYFFLLSTPSPYSRNTS